MSLNLSNPSAADTVTPAFWARIFATLARADNQNLKTNQDIEVGDNRVILRAPNGNRYALTVGNTGTLSTTGPL